MNLIDIEDKVHQIEKDVKDFYTSLEMARSYESSVKLETKRLTKISRINLFIGSIFIIIIIVKKAQ